MYSGCPYNYWPRNKMTWWRHQMEHFPRYWPFVRGIHRSPVNSPHKVQWRGSLMFSLICVRINCWVNNREAGDLRRHRIHDYVIVMKNGNIRQHIPRIFHYSEVTCAWDRRSPATRQLIQHLLKADDKRNTQALLALSERNPPVTAGFPLTKRDSNAESVSVSWRHHRV